jgi:site-specific DNA-cytosine methylase
MKVLSLFDGMSCGRIALDKLGVDCEYYAAEIDKYATKVSEANYPDIVRLGDVTKWQEWDIDWNFDLVLAGSPCQGFSIAGEKLAFDDPRSALFFTFIDILEHTKSVNPNVKFLLENVKMKKQYLDVITNYLGVQPVLINSEVLSYQKRPRFYWYNWNCEKPKDLNISFQDYIDTDVQRIKESLVNKTPSREKMWNDGKGRGTNLGGCANITKSDKVYCLTVKQDRSPNSGLVEYGDFCRYLTRRELEGAQNVPHGYTDVLSYNQCQKVLGNGWTVDVIVHILKGMMQ